MPSIYTADRIFTGDKWLQDHAVIVENGIVNDLLPVASLPGVQKVNHFDGCFIAPAFIDLQIYGAYDKLLAVYPEVTSLELLNEYCRKGGAARCLPTVATNAIQTYYQCIDAVREYWRKYQANNGILGVHLEGPWINPVKRGAHIESLIHPPAMEEVKALLDYGDGVIRMITLAPEVCSEEIIHYIRSRNIIISAGHCNATYEQANQGFANGIIAVTHLYNAMSALQHREPGLVGAAMDHKTAMASIIPDGYHVDFAAIRIAKQVMKDRLFVITDAVTGTTGGYYQHELAGDKYETAGILSGSALTMGKAVQNLVNFAGIELGEALKMCSLYPANLMNLPLLGNIKKGTASSMVVMDEKLEVKHLI